jgi:hypothetical protein
MHQTRTISGDLKICRRNYRHSVARHITIGEVMLVGGARQISFLVLCVVDTAIFK